MRTYFKRPGGEPVDGVTFAAGVLMNQKRAVQDQLGRLGFAAAQQIRVLDVTLGDPAKPVQDRALLAYVNNGAWLVKCECAGCELVDLERPVVMCASCWNLADDHQFRTVAVPLERAQIEAALVVRPDRANRNWKPTETVADLLAENAIFLAKPPAEEVPS
jgi:hypothetical protein